MFGKCLKAILVAATIFGSAQAMALSSDVIQLLKEKEDRPIPFPLDATLPFPWSSIEGTWEARKGDFMAYYAFKIVRRADGGNQLRVRQIQAPNCQTFATGVGVAKGDVVRAQMKDIKGQIYRMAVRALDHNKIPEFTGAYSGEMMGMTFSFVGVETESAKNLIISKISPRYDWNCVLPSPKR